MLLETDWLKVKEIWCGLGPNRNPRALQGWIERNYNLRMSMQELQAELSSRDFLMAALEHDKKIARRVDAMTVDTISERMATARLQSFSDMQKRFSNFGEIVDKALANIIKKAEFGKVSIDEVRRLMETYLKILQFQETYEIPMIPETDDETITLTRDPQGLARALLAAAKIRETNLSDLMNGEASKS